MPEREDEELELNTLIGGILQGLREAKCSGDLESARLHETYQKNPVLSQLSTPAFNISEMEIELHLGIVGPSKKPKRRGETPDLRVTVSEPALKRLEPHQMHTMRLKISPKIIRTFEEAE